MICTLNSAVHSSFVDFESMHDPFAMVQVAVASLAVVVIPSAFLVIVSLISATEVAVPSFVVIGTFDFVAGWFGLH